MENQRNPVGRPQGKSVKGRETERRILETAMALFARQGFGNTSLRQIATEAGVSPGLTYRYFSSKESIVIAWYTEHTESIQKIVSELPDGDIARRFICAFEHKLARLKPYRLAIPALLSTAIDPTSPAFLFGKETQRFRDHTRSLLKQVVAGATPKVPPDAVETLATLLFFAQLGFLLLWSMDSSAADATSKTLLKRFGRLINLTTPFLKSQSIRSLIGQSIDEIYTLLQAKSDRATDDINHQTGEDPCPI